MEQLELFSTESLTSSAAALPAKTFPWQEREPEESAEAEPARPSVGLGSILSAIYALGGSYGKMCQDVSRLASPSTEATSPNSRLRLANSGMVVRGALLTLNLPEWTHFQEPSHSAGGVCGLSDVLETMETEEDFRRLHKYFLSERACSGILRRAASRGKELPSALKDALNEQIRMWSNGELEGQGLDRNEPGVADILNEEGDINGDNERDEGCLPDGGLQIGGASE